MGTVALAPPPPPPSRGPAQRTELGQPPAAQEAKGREGRPSPGRRRLCRTRRASVAPSSAGGCPRGSPKPSALWRCRPGGQADKAPGLLLLLPAPAPPRRLQSLSDVTRAARSRPPLLSQSEPSVSPGCRGFPRLVVAPGYRGHVSAGAVGAWGAKEVGSKWAPPHGPGPGSARRTRVQVPGGVGRSMPRAVQSGAAQPGRQAPSSEAFAAGPRTEGVTQPRGGNLPPASSPDGPEPRVPAPPAGLPPTGSAQHAGCPPLASLCIPMESRYFV
ncbi:uncharacterized protein [Notamacropus eugenii]|uniref:uncharacterized protein n=1 Tax=Notamacropus eugenii TaxID=9315 RepID=UPI003B68461D